MTPEDDVTSTFHVETGTNVTPCITGLSGKKPFPLLFSVNVLLFSCAVTLFHDSDGRKQKQLQMILTAVNRMSVQSGFHNPGLSSDFDTDL